jgi:hypothetical protein
MFGGCDHQHAFDNSPRQKFSRDGQRKGCLASTRGCHGQEIPAGLTQSTARSAADCHARSGPAVPQAARSGQAGDSGTGSGRITDRRRRERRQPGGLARRSAERGPEARRGVDNTVRAPGWGRAAGARSADPGSGRPVMRRRPSSFPGLSDSQISLHSGHTGNFSGARLGTQTLPHSADHGGPHHHRLGELDPWARSGRSFSWSPSRSAACDPGPRGSGCRTRSRWSGSVTGPP